MRVLSVAAICGLVAVGCYDPALDDCQFKCGEHDACPAGASCTSGVCRDTAVGTCMTAGSGDAGMPSEAGIDAPATVCPTTSPCAETPVLVGSDDCAVLCKQLLTFGSAFALCGSDTGAVDVWHLAILDTPAKRTAFGQKLQTSIGWIGLQRTALSWAWLNGSNEPQASTGAPWASGEPSANPTNTDGAFDSTSGDVFRTGTDTDKKQFFCEYRP